MLRRTIGGIAYEGHPSEDRWIATLVDCGNGHREACVQRAHDWREVGPAGPYVDTSGRETPQEQAARYRREYEEAAQREADNAKRAARRAKTAVRRRCKGLGLDTLLTLTYHGLQDDLGLAQGHLAQFIRRMRAAYRSIGLEDFCHVGVFEPQKRGAWHVHLAVHKLPAKLLAANGVKVKSWNVIRAVWRKVAGDWGGNIDVGRWKGQARKSAAKCAAYISKYVLKDWAEQSSHARRYRWSTCALPNKQRLQFVGWELREMIAAVAAEFALDGGRVAASMWLSPYGDVFYVAGEAPG